MRVTDQPARLGIAIWGTQPVVRLIESVQRAERMGFESAWVIDSQLLCRDVFVTMGMCLAATSQIKLATGVTNPVTRHVSATAGALATLDEMFPGRVIAGIGTGFSSLRSIGRDAAKVAELEQFVRDLKALLGGKEATFAGGVRSGIEWLDRPGRVPISIAASGPKVTRLAGSVADGVVLLQGVAPDLMEQAFGWLTEGCDAAGRHSETLSVTAWVPLGIGATTAAGREGVRARVASAIMQKRPEAFSGRDREESVRLRQSYENIHHAASDPDHARLVSDRMIDRFAVAGDPDDVRDQLGALLILPALDRVVLTTHGGPLELDAVLDLMETVLSR